MRQVVDDHQAEINQAGVGFKGFIPAIFARLTNEEFGAIAGKEARIRVTAPPDLARSRCVYDYRLRRQCDRDQGAWSGGRVFSDQAAELRGLER